jgi:hypothetical protein
MKGRFKIKESSKDWLLPILKKYFLTHGHKMSDWMDGPDSISSICIFCKDTWECKISDKGKFILSKDNDLYSFLYLKKGSSSFKRASKSVCPKNKLFF